MSSKIEEYLRILEEEYLLEEPVSRKDAKNRCIDRADAFIEHFASIVSYLYNNGSDNTIEYWVKELISILNDMLGLKSSKNKLFDVDFIVNYLLDSKDIAFVIEKANKDTIDKSLRDLIIDTYDIFVTNIKKELQEKRNGNKAIRASLDLVRDRIDEKK